MILYPTGLAAMQLSDWILMNHFTPGGCLFYCTTQPLLDCNVDDDDTHLMAIFPTAWVSGYQNVSFLGFIAGNDDNWSYKDLQSSSQIVTIRKPTPSFLLAGSLSCCPTVSEHWREKCRIPQTCSAQTHLGSWLRWGGWYWHSIKYLLASYMRKTWWQWQVSRDVRPCTARSNKVSRARCWCCYGASVDISRQSLWMQCSLAGATAAACCWGITLCSILFNCGYWFFFRPLSFVME